MLSVDRCINYRDAGYAAQIVNACCVLHNFCIERRIPNPPPLFENDVYIDNEPNALPANVQERGRQEMQFLINYVNNRVHRNNVVNAL